jgi:simple sugar transport system ATP-binding protein
MANDNTLPLQDEVVLEAKGITKKFPGVLANDNINFDLRKGEIHA